MKKLLVILSAVIIVSCATNPYSLRNFNPDTHGSAFDEWSGHFETSEWWYVTGIVEDAESNVFFYQFTIFHGYIKTGQEAFSVHLALSDLAGQKHYFYNSAGMPGSNVYADEAGTMYRDSWINIGKKDGQISGMEIRGKARKFSFEFTVVPEKPVVWHGEDGIVVMGHEEDDNERSYYYSFTSMDTKGKITLDGREFSVKGKSWFDRQWGRFSEYYWDWFSFRLDDGREIMVFGFPFTGYTAGTIIYPDGTYRPLESAEYKVIDLSIRKDGIHTFYLGWSLTADGETFKVVPTMSDHSNVAPGVPAYWEGPCDVYDENDQRLGWCVVEATSPKFSH